MFIKNPFFFLKKKLKFKVHINHLTNKNFDKIGKYVPNRNQ